MGLTEDYGEGMEIQLERWDAEFALLAEEGDLVRENVRTAYHKRMEALRVARLVAAKTFQEMRSATESAGSQMHAGMELAWETIRQSLEKASAELRK